MHGYIYIVNIYLDKFRLCHIIASYTEFTFYTYAWLRISTLFCDLPYT